MNGYIGKIQYSFDRNGHAVGQYRLKVKSKMENDRFIQLLIEKVDYEPYQKVRFGADEYEDESDDTLELPELPEPDEVLGFDGDAGLAMQCPESLDWMSEEDGKYMMWDGNTYCEIV